MVKMLKLSKVAKLRLEAYLQIGGQKAWQILLQ